MFSYIRGEACYAAFCQRVAPIRKPVRDVFGRMASNDILLKSVVKKFFDNSSKKRTSLLSAASHVMSDNFIVGEDHTAMSPKKFLMENMQVLKKAGFTTLFMEHLFYDDQQDLDDYFRTGKFSDKLKQRLDDLDNGFGVRHSTGKDSETTSKCWSKYNYTALVKAAREAGVRIVGIDIENVYKAQAIGVGNEQKNIDSRLAYMNYTAQVIINREQSGHSGKWCALMGNTHVRQFSHIPGVADLTGARAVYVFDEAERNRLARMEVNASFVVDEDVTFRADLLIHNHPDNRSPSLSTALQSTSTLGSVAVMLATSPASGMACPRVLLTNTMQTHAASEVKLQDQMHLTAVVFAPTQVFSYDDAIKVANTICRVASRVSGDSFVTNINAVLTNVNERGEGPRFSPDEMMNELVKLMKDDQVKHNHDRFNKILLDVQPIQRPRGLARS